MLDMVAHAGLGEQIQQGSGQREDTLGRRISSIAVLALVFLRDSVLCFHCLQPDGHIFPGNGLPRHLSHSTDPNVTSHQQLKFLIPLPVLCHSH